MKRKLFNQAPLKQTILAVPAAALMLGAAQAGTTIGLNFQAWYYDSGTTPQKIGFGQGYQTTGFPVTAKAFGVIPANWVNTDPLDCSAAVATNVTLGSVTANLSAVNPWSGDIGNLVNPADEWTNAGPLQVSTSSVLPGNDEVTWGFEDNTGWTNHLSGLSTAFPNGYVIELIGAVKCTANSRVVVTAGATTTTNAFDTIYTAGNSNYPGPVGLLAIPGASDTITFGAVTRNISSAQSCALAGFILTDQPVVTRIPAKVSVNQSSSLDLTARVIGVGPVSYQWQHAGTNFPGATTVPFSKTANPEDGGSWVLVATNLYGTATSDAVTVTVNQIPLISTDLSPTTSTVYRGTRIVLSVVAGGAAPLTYLWYKNGSLITGATSASLTVSNLTLGLAGYSVTVSNQFSPPVVNSSTNYMNVVAAPDAYTVAVVADSPNSHWPLGETTGVTANDYSGYAHNGAISNSMTLGAIGPRPPTYAGFQSGKTAYQFDGASAYIDLGTGPSLAGTTDFTLEAWVNTTSTTDGRIIQQRDPNGFNGEYAFAVNADGTVYFMVYGGGYQFSFSTTKKVNDGLWHHVAAVRTATNGVIYIDGTVATTASSSYLAPLDATIKTYIGADVRASSTYFNGLICDAAIYARALSPSQIGLHAYTGSLGNAPVLIKIVPGGYIADTKPSGTPHPGLNNGAAWTASLTDTAAIPVTRNGVEEFNGGSQIVAPATPDLNTANGTITFWLRANAPIPGPGTEGAMLFDRRTTNGTVIVLHDDGSIFWQGQGGSQNSVSGGYVPDNNWHHIAVTYGQTSSDTISIYVDGVLSASTPVTNGWTWPISQELEIGASHDAYWKTLNGQMDDFRVYNRVLTATEVGQVFANDALVDQTALVLRYNFDTAGAGKSLSWPTGPLLSSPTLGPSAVWTPVPNAASPYPFLPPAPSVTPNAELFYRIAF
ncbi:MAG TPA: LamG-like jellyroll fold domain-containing protein [Candidatus Acidoferrum sp.]|jgi:hypothetical protein|nr:LamG-like jellyroll fold domain-containing protein [Candidatus Acidoferrum sp.]